MRKGLSVVLMLVSVIMLTVSICYLGQCREEKQQMLTAVEKLKTTGQSVQPEIYKKVKRDKSEKKMAVKQQKKESKQNDYPVSINLEQIEKHNSQVTAWIEIPDISIFYPIV